MRRYIVLAPVGLLFLITTGTVIHQTGPGILPWLAALFVIGGLAVWFDVGSVSSFESQIRRAFHAFRAWRERDRDQQE